MPSYTNTTPVFLCARAFIPVFLCCGRSEKTTVCLIGSYFLCIVSVACLRDTDSLSYLLDHSVHLLDRHVDSGGT